MQPPPPVTRALLIALLAVFVVQQIAAPVERWLALYPVQSGFFMPWQVLSYAFLHADMSHVFFNMLALWMFGVELELLWGPKRYIQFLLAGALAAAAAYLLLSLVMPVRPIVGASGAIFGLLIAWGVLFPQRQILFFMVYPTTMRNAVFLFGGLEILILVIDRGTGAATNIAHLGGMLGGYLMLLWWRHRPPSFKRPPIRRVH